MSQVMGRVVDQEWGGSVSQQDKGDVIQEAGSDMSQERGRNVNQGRGGDVSQQDGGDMIQEAGSDVRRRGDVREGDDDILWEGEVPGQGEDQQKEERFLDAIDIDVLNVPVGEEQTEDDMFELLQGRSNTAIPQIMSTRETADDGWKAIESVEAGVRWGRT